MTANDHNICIVQPNDITPDELHDAYVFCRLRRIGIGYVQAIESPVFSKALRNTAHARKTQRLKLKLVEG